MVKEPCRLNDRKVEVDRESDSELAVPYMVNHMVQGQPWTQTNPFYFCVSTRYLEKKD